MSLRHNGDEAVTQRQCDDCATMVQQRRGCGTIRVVKEKEKIRRKKIAGNQRLRQRQWRCQRWIYRNGVKEVLHEKIK